MAINIAEWTALAATISAMCDMVLLGRPSFDDLFRQRIGSSDAQARGIALSQMFSTYSDDEIKAIGGRLQSCRQRFISEGHGENRKLCLCSVLTDVKDGNGGTIPFDDWQQTYKTLGCN